MAVSFAPNHNGGRVQIGLNDIFVGNDFLLINWVKGCDGWVRASDNKTPPPTYFNSDNYPTSLPEGELRLQFFCPPQSDLGGECTLRWTGNCTLAVYAGTVTTTGGSLTSTTGSGLYKFTMTGNSITVGILSMSSQLGGLECYSSSEETRRANGEIFGAKLMDRLINELRPGIIRDLDLTSGNVCNVTKASDLKPVTSVFYKGSELRASLYGGDTTLSRITYSVAAPPSFSGLTNKNIVHFNVKQNSPVTTFVDPAFTQGSQNIGVPSHNMQVGDPFVLKSDNGAMPGNFVGLTSLSYVQAVVDANTIRASLTPGGPAITCGIVPNFGDHIYLSPCIYLEVGTSAAKIMIGHGWPMISGDNTYPTANKIGTAVYDSTLDMWLMYGGCVGYGDRGICNGVPPDVFLQLCAQVGAHPHFVKEGLSCYPEADVSTYKASLVRDLYNGDSTKLCPWMVPSFEGGPNETWNTASDFWNTHYFMMLAPYLGSGWSLHDFYGMAVSTTAQKVNAVYGGDKTKFTVGVGVQTGADGNDTGFDVRANAQKWVTSGLPAQSGLTAAPAKNYATLVLHPASYWNTAIYGNYDGTETRTDMANRYAAATDPNVQAQILEDFIGSGLQLTGWPFEPRTQKTTLYAGWQAYAVRNGITLVRAYEGGYSCDEIGGPALRALCNLGKVSQAAAVVEMLQFSTWVGMSANGVTWEYPSLFHLSDLSKDASSTGEGWGIFANGATIYGPVTPRYLAICNWSTGKRSHIRLHR